MTGKRLVQLFLALVTFTSIFILFYTLQESLGLFQDFNVDGRVHINFPKFLSEEEEIVEIEANLPSLPASFWFKHKGESRNLNGSCSPFPNLMELDFVDLYWQKLETSNGTFKFFGAYLDDRALNPKPFIRILGMVNRRKPNVTTHCQVWFEEEKKPFFAEFTEYRFIWIKEWGEQPNGKFQPYLISCPLPQTSGNFTPIAVSLVEKPCDKAKNLLKVFYNKPKAKKEFAVCTKGLSFLYSDVSIRLAEWIEILGILGIEKIYIYEQALHPNVKKLLDYYINKGFVEVTKLSLGQGGPNAPFLKQYYLERFHNFQHETIPYNDCFLKHMYEYKYIALFDIDEFIMPLQTMNYHDLFEVIVPKSEVKKKGEKVSSYIAHNVYFLDGQTKGLFANIPSYHHILHHTMRSRNFTPDGYYIKAFHNTERVLTVHNHFPFSCIGGSCVAYSMEKTDAQLNHYRKNCVGELKSICTKTYREKPLNDSHILRFQMPLVQGVRNALRIF